MRANVFDLTVRGASAACGLKCQIESHCLIA